MKKSIPILILAAAAFAVAAVTCTGSNVVDPGKETVPAFETLIAVADIAACDSQGDEATAALVDTMPGTIIVAGDITYESGTAREFADCYEPSWGRHRSRTRPAPGNHEYVTADAKPYFDYFGVNAGPAGRGYYSFDLGAWHIISLNSNIDATAGSAQAQWLKDDLAASRSVCTLAYWHHPLFSSGLHGSGPKMRAIWQLLYESGADVVVSGHDHHYERFAPQTAAGVLDSTRGIREFIVGTGGRSHYPALFAQPNTERRADKSDGVLRLKLGARDYAWEFVPTVRGGATDSGTTMCR
ncbi:MAG: metallophosphoesterase [Gemmatimonadaceae bacterium]